MIRKIPIFIMYIMMLFSLTPHIFAASNIDATNKYAWSTNTGWINFNDANGSVTIYEDHLEGYAWAGNIGWIRLGTYTGGGTHIYTNTSQTDYGINHDGAGNLSGYAWSSDVGWINFNPTHSQVTIDLVTGDFDGYAYAANVGWIHFQNASPAYKVTYRLIPYSPTGLNATPTSQTQINLSWTDNSDNETGFKIERTGYPLPTTAADVTSYSDSNLSCGTTYSYSVKATNVNGDSSAISTTATTLACPSPTPSYKLTIEKPNGGTITGNGINCGSGTGSDCQQYFERGTKVSLTAIPANTWTFDNWTGDCDSDGTILITNDSVCSAAFTKQYNLALTTNGQGTIENCGTQCTQSHPNGETPQLSATPTDGWQFSGWTGDCDNEGNVTMNNDKACQANFIQIFTLTVALVGSGTVTSEPINCGDNCTADYPINTSVALLAEPEMEWVSDHFSEDCDSQGHVQMTSDKTCIATFIADPNIPNHGDANNDGIPDSQQNHVVTIPDQVDGEYLTLEVELTCSIDDAYTDLPGSQGEYEHSYQFPQGLMYFELGCAETDVTVYFHALQRAQNPILKKYGPTTPGDLTTLGWYTISNVTYGLVMIDNQPVVTATYHLKDGELGDNTGVDGRIIDPMGIAFSNDFDSIISFVSDKASASTQSSSISIPVNRLGSDGTVSVDYTTVNGSAIAGQDYQATSGTLTWADGDLDNKIIIINLTNNATAGKTLSLALSNLTASGNAVLALDNLSITITDDPPVEEIPVEEIPAEETLIEETPAEETPVADTTLAEGTSTEDPSVNEEPGTTTTANTTTAPPNGNNLISFTNQGYISYKNDGTALITVNRNGTKGIVSIDYTTINGTAIANQDYQSANGTLTWANGEDGLKSFEVALLDTATLGNSLILSLGNLSDTEGQFGTDIAVLTILDEIASSNLATTADGQTTTSTSGEEDTGTQSTTNDVETTSTTDTTSTGTVNDPTVVVPTDILASDVIVEGGKIDDVFNARGQIFYEDIIVTEKGSVSNARFEANVNNQGLISNSSFGPEAIVTGGRLSGDIVNEGTCADVNFVGMSLTGGTLSGNVTNTSQIGGIIQDIQLAPGATLTGGKIGGTIKSAPDSILANVQLTAGTRVSGGTITGEISGDPNNPPIITAANIAPGTVLSNVRISPTVELPTDVILLGPGVLLPSEPPTLEDFGYEIADIATLDAEKLAQLEPTVFGTFGAEEMAAIPPESFSQTRSEQVAEMNEEGTAAMTPEQFNAMPPEAMSGMTEENMGSVSEEVMAEMQEEHIKEMKPETFGGMEQQQLAAISPETMKAMDSEKMAQLPKETLGGLSTKQFEQLPAQALSGLKSDNMGGLSTDVLNDFTPEHLSALDASEFTQMTSEDVSKMFTNFDANQISVQNVAQLVPPGWQIDPQSGEIIAPEGSKLTPRTFPVSGTVPAAVQLPSIANIETGIGLGGQGTSIKENMTRSLEEQDLTDFVLSQNEETGILWVEGTGDSEGIKYTFIPDIDNVIQVDGDKVPIGLAVTEGGFYTITTPDEKQYQVVPAPQDPIALSEVLDGGEVVIGQRGDVMMDIPLQTRQRGKPRQVAMFDPLIQPAPDDLCVEIAPGEIVCDFDNAPPSQQPGIHIVVNTRAVYKNQPQAKVVFPDGTAQLITPTLLTPDLFAELGFEFEGVEDIVFNANGIFYVLYQGKSYLIVPKFEVVTEEVTEAEIAADADEQPGESSIVINSDGTLAYTVVIDKEENNTRKRGQPRQVMQFQPAIEMVPDDLCVEILPGEIVCDFE